MKAFRFGWLATRKFPAWLQAFNLLCGATALAILGFGLYLLATRDRRGLEGVLERDGRGVDRAALAAALDDPARTAALGRALAAASDGDRTAVLVAAREAVHPAALALAADAIATRGAAPGSSAAIARRILVDGLGTAPGVDDAALAERARAFVGGAAGPGAVARITVAFHAIVRGGALERRRAVDRLVEQQDARGTVALLVALRAPAGEEATIEAADRELRRLFGEPPDARFGAEGRWNTFFSRAVEARAKPPFDPLAEGDALLRELDAARAPGADPSLDPIVAVRGLGLLGEARAAAPIAELARARDPLLRATALWALARTGGSRGATTDAHLELLFPLLPEALDDPYAPARAAAAWALGRMVAPREVVPALARRLEDPDATVRRVAALALLALDDPRGAPPLETLAFDASRPPGARLRELEAIDAHAQPGTGAAFWLAALGDPDATVRAAAQAALERRSGHREVRNGRASWERWWRERFEHPPIEIPRGFATSTPPP